MVFIEELVKHGILDGDEAIKVVRLAEEKYEGSIDQALLEFNFDAEKILKIKGEIFGIPIKNVNPRDVPPSVIKLIPIDAARMYKFIPINVTDSFLEVGIIDPENIQALDALTFITAKLNKPFKLFLIAFPIALPLFSSSLIRILPIS